VFAKLSAHSEEHRYMCNFCFPFIQTGFDMDDVVRKYIRYTLNEKQFNPDVVVDLIHLRKASMLEDAEVAEILNEISRRIVREKGIFILLILVLLYST
jgi:hypothetical protein